MAHKYFREGAFQPPKGHEQDIKHLRDWLKGNPHLPTISDEHLYIFLNSCNYQITKTKETLENYYCFRTSSPQLFSKRDATSSDIKSMLDISHIVPLKWTTAEGYRVVLCRLSDYDAAKFDFLAGVKMLFMFMDVLLAEKGLDPGWIVLFDTKGATFGHLARVQISAIKLFLTYVQECQPIALKAVHIFNVVPVIDKALILAKPFIKGEILKMLQFHGNVEELVKHIPLSSLPEEYGGQFEKAADVHAKFRALLIEYSKWFQEEELFQVDESKRIGGTKHPYFAEFQGTEGSFRKLDID